VQKASGDEAPPPAYLKQGDCAGGAEYQQGLVRRGKEAERAEAHPAERRVDYDRHNEHEDIQTD